MTKQTKCLTTICTGAQAPLQYLPESNKHFFPEKLGQEIAFTLQWDMKPKPRLRRSQQPTVRAISHSVITKC